VISAGAQAKCPAATAAETLCEDDQSREIDDDASKRPVDEAREEPTEFMAISVVARQATSSNSPRWTTPNSSRRDIQHKARAAAKVQPPDQAFEENLGKASSSSNSSRSTA